jgi:hypothetical protein
MKRRPFEIHRGGHPLAHFNRKCPGRKGASRFAEQLEELGSRAGAASSYVSLLKAMSTPR